MPWMEASTVYLRQEFLALANQTDSNLAALCRRFGVSRKTAYKWLGRCGASGGKDPAAALDRSRRPKSSPAQTAPEMEQRVCDLRRRHPAWGGRKIHSRLLALGHTDVPSPSTVTDILRRYCLLNTESSAIQKQFVRFEHPHPNDLWQMDFIGHFAMDLGRCHPLTVIDDHSRFCLGVRACENETGKTVQNHLTDLFRLYGLPWRILCDNGSPWGCDSERRHTWLSAWMIRLGIWISHGRPYHPQTQGKDERFNRTVKAEVIGTRRFANIPDVQSYFDPWRDICNLERPHEAIGMQPPATRYRPSPREFPQTLPAIEYSPGDIVRKVQKDGYLRYKTNNYKISQAFVGYPVGLRHTNIDGQLDVFFCHVKVASIDLKQQTQN
jgi:transposase InsO family protein